MPECAGYSDLNAFLTCRVRGLGIADLTLEVMHFLASDTFNFTNHIRTLQVGQRGWAYFFSDIIS